MRLLNSNVYARFVIISWFLLVEMLTPKLLADQRRITSADFLEYSQKFDKLRAARAEDPELLNGMRRLIFLASKNADSSAESNQEFVAAVYVFAGKYFEARSLDSVSDMIIVDDTIQSLRQSYRDFFVRIGEIPGKATEKLTIDLAGFVSSTIYAQTLRQNRVIRTQQKIAVEDIRQLLSVIREFDASFATTEEHALHLLEIADESLRSTDAQEALIYIEKALFTACGKLGMKLDNPGYQNYRYTINYLRTFVRATFITKAAKLPTELQNQAQKALALLQSESGYESSLTQSEIILAGIEKDLGKYEGMYKAYVAPTELKSELLRDLAIAKDSIIALKQQFSASITGFSHFSYNYNYQTEDSLESLAIKIAELRETVRNQSDRTKLARMYDYFKWLQPMLGYYAESVMERSTVAPKYLTELNVLLTSIGNGYGFHSDKVSSRLRAAMRNERGEGVFRAYINEKNATIGAVGTLLAVELVAVPFSGGASAGTVPATMQLLTMGASIGARGFLLAQAGANLYARAYRQQLKGLFSWDSAVDALTILTLSPRYVPTSAASFWSSPGRGFMRFIAWQQYSAGGLLTVGSAGYGSYLLLRSEEIASSLQADGIQVDASEIRRRGLECVALAALHSLINMRFYNGGVSQHGESFKEAFKPAVLNQYFGKNLNVVGRQIEAVRKAYTSNSGLMRGIYSAALAGGYFALDLTIVNEAALFSYANLDSNYMRTIEARNSFPQFRERETAVILVGFEKEDFVLYQGAHSIYSHHSETESFGAENVFVYDFKSPEDVTRVLKTHASLHGKIRYLKIATHGRPGRLFTEKVNGIPEIGDEYVSDDAWIDTDWLERNRLKISNIAREAMAPDARIVLWACLSGANLDGSVVEHSSAEELNIGDEFLESLGDVFLVNGGSIDASTRVLVGIDSTVGSLAWSGLRQSFAGRPRVPLFGVAPVVIEEPETNELNNTKKLAAYSMVKRIEQQAEYEKQIKSKQEPVNTEDSIGVFQRLGQRVGNFAIAWPPYWWTYGVELEGPFWHSRYSHKKFRPH